MKEITKERKIIIRKIRLHINYPKKEKTAIKDSMTRLRGWQKIIFMASNIACSLLYLQEQLKEVSFFTDEYKLKLTNNLYDKGGILNTSQLNSINRSISNRFKSQIPSNILTAQIHSIYAYFNKEKSEYHKGIRSLRSYKWNTPVPIKSKDIHDLEYNIERENFTFSFFKRKEFNVPLITYLGKDRSNNRLIIENCITKKYKLLTSSYSFNNKGQLFFNLTVEIPKQTEKRKELIIAQTTLSFACPIILNIESLNYTVSDNIEYIFKRQAIRNSLIRKQQCIKYNKGGRGRKNKLKNIRKHGHYEKNFIKTYCHQISRRIINLCLKHNVTKLQLYSVNYLSNIIKDDTLAAQNWSVGILINMLKYKCSNNNIEILLS